MKVGKPSKTLTERNDALFIDYLNGLRGAELAKKYKISKVRASQIVNRARILQVAPSLEYNDK